MKRLIDLVLCALLVPLVAPIAVVVAIAVRLDSPGPALHWSLRVGRFGKPFWMPKFRTMHSDTPEVATHLLENPQSWITRTGRWLRRTSLDEAPQLLCIATGQMSFVGPRPALTSQHDLNALRAKHGIDRLRPGLTGWAQINGRDELSIPAKVAFEKAYLHKANLRFDGKILTLTLLRVARLTEFARGPVRLTLRVLHERGWLGPIA